MNSHTYELAPGTSTHTNIFSDSPLTVHIKAPEGKTFTMAPPQSSGVAAFMTGVAFSAVTIAMYSLAGSLVGTLWSRASRKKKSAKPEED